MEKKGLGKFPTLEGLEMDWDYCPDCRDGKRLHKRLSKLDVAHLYGNRQVEVKMADLSSYDQLVSTAASAEGVAA